MWSQLGRWIEFGYLLTHVPQTPIYLYAFYIVCTFKSTRPRPSQSRRRSSPNFTRTEDWTDLWIWRRPVKFPTHRELSSWIQYNVNNPDLTNQDIQIHLHCIWCLYVAENRFCEFQTTCYLCKNVNGRMRGLNTGVSIRTLNFKQLITNNPSSRYVYTWAWGWRKKKDVWCFLSFCCFLFPKKHTKKE